MKVSRNLQPRQIGPWSILMFAVVAGACSILSLTGLTAWIFQPATIPAPAAQVARLSTYTPSPGPSPTRVAATAELNVSPTPSLTPTPDFTPTFTPLPTGWFVAPANPTPIATPVLPPAASFPTDCNGPGRMNILIIGVDGRGADFSGRSDTLMVAGVNFSDKTAQLLSIPRDLWIQMPEWNGQPPYDNRINTAFPIGGADYLAATIEANLGLRLDRYVVVNFSTFVSAIDAIGGIDINVPTAIYDPAYPMGDGRTMLLEIPAGLVHMDGEVALMYARTRHQDSDFGRMRRQHQVIMAARQQLLQPQTLAVLPSLAQLMYQSVVTNLSVNDIALLGCVGPQISDTGITRIVIDQTMTIDIRTDTGAQVLQPNMEVILPVLAAFNEGE